MNFFDYSILVIYLVFTLGLGAWIGRRQGNTEDYFLAGRRMKWWPVAISLFASLFSAISYIAMPGEAYNHGCNLALGGLTGIIALPVMLFIFLKFFYNMRLFTINEYLEKRFDSSIRILVGALYMILRFAYLGVIFYATGLLLEGALGWPPWMSILLIGVFTTIYTYLGGMEAIIWTDVAQFVVMMGGVVLIIGFVVWQMPGGIAGVWEFATENSRTFDLSISSGVWSWDLAQRISFWMILLSVPLAMITPATDQGNLQRCMTCRDFREVARAVSASALANLPICLLFYFAGLCVFAYFKSIHPELDDAARGGDTAFVYFVSNVLPGGLRGLLVAGILAAVMSSVDSVINSVAAVFIKDLYQQKLAPGRDEKHYIKASGIASLVIGLAASLVGLVVLMIFANRDIPLVEVTNICLGILGAFSTGIFVTALLTRRTNATGIWIALAVCVPVTLAITIFGYLLKPREERIGFLFLITLPVFLEIAVAYAASFFAGRNREESWRYVIWSRWRKKTDG